MAFACIKLNITLSVVGGCQGVSKVSYVVSSALLLICYTISFAKANEWHLHVQNSLKQ